MGGLLVCCPTRIVTQIPKQFVLIYFDSKADQYFWGAAEIPYLLLHIPEASRGSKGWKGVAVRDIT